MELSQPNPPIQVHIVHHTPTRRARTRIVAANSGQLTVLANHLRKSKHVQAVHQTARSLVVYHDLDLGELIGHIEAEGIAEVLHLPAGSDTILERLGPRVLTMTAVAVIWFML